MRTIPIPSARRLAAMLMSAAPAAALLAACGPQVSPPQPGGRVRVVAAESTWGSIAAQVGGDHAQVTSIVANPAVDPHAYEPTPADARSLAVSFYVVVNGAGYDPWAGRLLDADPLDGRIVLDVAELAGRRQGDNPHLWYSPNVVHQVVRRVAADLGRLDPHDAAYFDARASAYETAALRRYDDLRGGIRERFHGVPVGATESVFVDMANDLGLSLATPAGYMKAVSEGDDPASADKSAADAQVRDRHIRVLVYNRQNSTPDVQALVDLARAEGIPVVAVTETLDPPGGTFQDWQATQLAALQAALAQANR